jgi:1,4-alpha-glucan branching enzyme
MYQASEDDFLFRCKSSETGARGYPDMKVKALIMIVPFLLPAFNYEKSIGPRTLYLQSLKFLKQADPPQKVMMVRTDHSSGGGPMLEHGVLFTYKNREAKLAYISGNFSGWKPKRMLRSDNGVWYYFLSSEGKEGNIEYKYLVDDIWITDPLNSDRMDDGMGSYISIAEPFIIGEGFQVTYRITGGNSVEFRIYNPHARFVSIVGDFNNWNPENDILTRGKDGIWRLEKKLFPGVYRYKYVIDGDWVPDYYNSRSASDNTGEICSIIEIWKK